MFKLPRFTLTLVLLLTGWCAAVQSASAQRAVPTPEHPPMASKEFDSEKEIFYAAFSANKRNPSPENQNRAYRAAKEFIRHYDGDDDNYLKEAKQFVADFEKQIRQYEVYAAYTAKKYDKAFELGRPLLQVADDFFVLSVLAEAGYESTLAGNASFKDETVSHLRRAIQLAEAGKVSRWDPFKSAPAANGFLNLALGFFLKDQAPVEATAAFVKAVQPDSPYANDPLTHYRLGVTTLKGEFAQLSAEYNEKFGAQRGSAEQQAMLERINRAGNQAVDSFARSYALSDPNNVKAIASTSQLTPEFRAKVLQQLTALYKGFHNDSDAGLNELIATVLSRETGK